MVWRPTHLAPGERYARSQARLECHEDTAAQLTTPMARALEAADKGRILREHPRLTFRLGEYSYTIARDGNRSIYSVTDGRETITAPILWAFGQGMAG
jgi:hypothetical protein